MFAILDANHYVELLGGSALGRNFAAKADENQADLFTSIITVQEISAGWTGRGFLNRCCS